MNQRLSDLANLAQIVSGIAVVVTLVFLVMEIREGTNVTRASMYASTLDSLIENRTQRIEHPELNQLVERFVDGEASGLDVDEKSRLVPFLQNLYQVYEKAFFAKRYGVIGEAEWGRFQRIICENHSRVVSAGLLDSIKAVTTEDFSEYIAETCSG